MIENAQKQQNGFSVALLDIYYQSKTGFGKLEAIDCSIADENNALLTALEVGDPMEVESALYDIDHEDDA